MSADYKNWIPKGLTAAFGGAAAACAAGEVLVAALGKDMSKPKRVLSHVFLGLGAAAATAGFSWCVYASRKYSYSGKRQLAKQIIEGTADFVSIPEGGTCLDVGCGSGALTIACAKRNPSATIIGLDRWGMEYASFSKELCEENAKEEGVRNTSFVKGNAVKLDFEDESFDAVTSNYVYHNIPFRDKQKLLLETLRVLKKGGSFAIHDIFSDVHYGDIYEFANELRRAGYEDVKIIHTDTGLFMSRGEAISLGLKGSALLVGIK